MTIQDIVILLLETQKIGVVLKLLLYKKIIKLFRLY